MPFIYCYGIVEDNTVVQVSGFNDVVLLPYKDIFAVTSSVEENAFSQDVVNQRVRDMVWLSTHAPIHERVVDAYNQITTIIPMKFCTIFTTEQSLIAMLEKQYAHFRTNLEYLRGKGEMSVKVYTDSIHATEEIIRVHPELQQMINSAKELSPGKSYFELKKLDDTIQGLIQERVAKECEVIESCVQHHSLEMKNKSVVEQKGSHMIMNVACLIEKKNQERLRAAICTTKVSVVKCIVTGPFAAYNFIH